MADETHKLQKDPPEGSREVIEHELRRKSEQDAGSGEKPENSVGSGGRADVGGGPAKTG